MELISHDLLDQSPIDPRFAFGRPSHTAPMELSTNLSPHLQWSDFPEDTASFALLCMDPDVPSVADDVNQEGRTISKDLPRVQFCHWAMINLPRDCTELATGECSHEVTIGGKSNPSGPPGSIQGLNDYTQFMAQDPQMRGQYYGYDGPCPPWNDERLHHYVFTVYALSVERLDLAQPFTGHQVLVAIEGLVLDAATLTGTYTLLKS